MLTGELYTEWTLVRDPHFSCRFVVDYFWYVSCSPTPFTLSLLLLSQAKISIFKHFNSYILRNVGRDSSVGIANRYGLDGPGIESRWWRIFCNRPDRSWGSPSLLYNGYQVFPGGKTAGAWRWPPIPIEQWGYTESRTILLAYWAFVACSRVNFTQYYSREWNTALQDSPAVTNLLCVAFNQPDQFTCRILERNHDI